MKRNKRGFTLIELIVIIALMGIMAGVLGISISTASTAKQRECATNINSYISMCRTRCLSRAGNPYILITRDAGNGTVTGRYFENDTLMETEVLGNKSIPVSYSVGKDSSAEAAKLDSSPALKISFARATGAVTSPSSDLWVYIGKYKIKVYALTGAHRFE